MRTYKPSEAVDFVVIGSGAAVGVMAKELSTAGLSVVVLEQGPWMKEAEFTHDELKFYHRGGLVNNPKLQPNTFRKTEAEPAVLKPVVGYGRMVGGGMVHFTANYWRFHEIDFEERSKWGPIAGTSFADWPIRYADLEPYYTKAEWDIGVSGQAGANPFDPPRTKPYPLPPMPVKSSGVLFERAANKLGWHPYPAPVAILSRSFKGRGACMHCGFCEGFGCEMRAKSSPLATVIPDALKTGRCEIRPNSVVRKIQSDAAGRVTGAVYFDREGKEIFQRARNVAVCANGAETPRLLLLSKSNRFPQGLANSSGVVGRNLMFDAGPLVSGVFEEPLNEYKSIQVTRLIHDFHDADPKRGFYGGAGIDARFDYYPASFALNGLPDDAPRWGEEYKAMLNRYFTRTMSVLAHTTCLPVPQNSISLDPTVKDAWGLPAVRVTFRNHPDDLATMRFMAERCRELLEAAGAQRVWGAPVEEVTDSVHLMGTCRMGSDAALSVVNAENRAHDVPNLWVVDGSSLVSSGRQQPTATIQALAYRAADRIVRRAGRA